MKQSECKPADDWRERFARDGFLSPIRILDDLEPAAVARQRELDRQVRETMGLTGP